MDRVSGPTGPPPTALGINHFLLIAGFAQVAAAFAPAGYIRLRGHISFIGLPSAGLAFLVLGLLTALTALRPHGWWRWIPGLTSIGLLSVVYAKLRYAPSGGFFDPMLRRVVRPAWGFVPMALAALFTLVAAATVRLESRASLSDQPNERG